MEPTLTPRPAKRSKTPEEALAALMRLCARAEKSTGDALRLMESWGVDPAARQGVLDTLLAQRFIDDARYAAAFVREKSRLNGWGVYKIRQALQRKRVARGTIEEALAAIDRGEALERLATLLERKRKRTKAASSYDLYTKLMRYGLSLGYDHGAVAEALRTLPDTEPPCDEPFFE